MQRKSPAIERFLERRRVAVVGVSRDPRSFSRAVFTELRRRDYDAIPVNPAEGGTIDGIACAQRVQDIDPPPEAALLLTRPSVTEQVVKDCRAAGVRAVWMHRGVGKGAASPAAVHYCRANGIEVVTDACPFMYLPRTPLVHRAHRWCREAWRRSPATPTARVPPGLMP